MRSSPIGAVLDISRKATVAQVGEAVVSWCFAGCVVQALIITAATTTVVVVYVTMQQAMFGRPTRMQQVSSPRVRPLLPELCSAL